MTWFGWIMVASYILTLVIILAVKSEKSVDRKALEFVLNSLVLAGLLFVGTGHL